MAEVVDLHARQSSSAGDELWAVVAQLGRESRVAEVFASRARALADREWREREVRAYAGLLRSSRQPMPHYSVAPVRRLRPAAPLDAAAGARVPPGTVHLAPRLPGPRLVCRACQA